MAVPQRIATPIAQHEAIYARQSVDKVDSISTESQVEICLREVQDPNYKVYIDKGYSGKNTDRPAWQELLSDIRAGKISKVVTYRLDRISRSVLDFANIIDIFKKYNVSFSSTTEKFDTSSPIGNAMLLIVMVFAQLERETIQQRVTDAYRNRSEKGFYMGGRIPYGYALSDIVIDSIRTKCYLPIPEEARVVELIFDMYANPQTSLGDIVRELNRLEIKNRHGKPFRTARIREIICNPAYAKADLSLYEFFSGQGAEILNQPSDFIGTNGCYLYSGHTKKRKTVRLDGHRLVLAPHQGLIDSYTWIQCRKKCLVNSPVAKPLKAKNTWLAGKIKCAKCHYSLTAKITPRQHKEPYKYLVCHSRYESGECSGVGVLYLDEVHDVILQQIKTKLQDFSILTGRNDKPDPTSAEILQLQIRIDEIDAEIENLIGSLAVLKGAAIDLVNTKLNKLADEKLITQRKIDELTTKKKEVNLDAITDYVNLWDELSFDDKRNVVDALIEVIYADQESIEVHWKI